MMRNNNYKYKNKKYNNEPYTEKITYTRVSL